MRKFNSVLAGALGALCMLAGSVPGAITYIDAELGSTTCNGEPLQAGVNCSTDYSADDGLWGWRTNRTDVNGSGIWVTDGGTASVADVETTEPLKVDFTLPEAGVYDLYVIIMNNNGGTGHWDVAVRIGDSGYFSSYNKYSEVTTLASASDFVGTVKVATGTGDVTCKVKVGRYVAQAANEAVSIYVNGLDSWNLNTGLDQRTRFDGVGYEKVTDLLPYAQKLSPANGAINVLTEDAELSWKSGYGIENHNVYIGTDAVEVAFDSDVDGSGIVDMEDMANVAGDWQEPSSGYLMSQNDIDGSGIIDLADLQLLARDWLMGAGNNLLGSYSAETLSCGTGSLVPGETYYWKVDESDGENIYKGNLWQFKTFNGDGLTATIYNGSYLSEPVVTRVDSIIHFDWGKEAPADGVDIDSFSIAWTGGITVPTEGEYTFYAGTDDGVRLYVNDMLIIDNWVVQSQTQVSGKTYLRPGFVYSIRMEYYDNSGSASAYLGWEGPGVSKQLIPTRYMCSTEPVVIPDDIWVLDFNSMPYSMRLLSITLEGLLSKDEPVILAKQGGLTDMIREDLEAEGTVFHDNASVWYLLQKFESRIAGLILCGSDLESRNAATSLCGPMNAIAVDESILAEVQSRVGLEVLADTRGMVEQDIYDNYKELFDHEVMVDVDKIDFLRDISVARNAFTFYDVDSTTRRAFVSGLTTQGFVLGWGSNAEFNWVKDVSSANAAGVPADWCKNLSTLSKLKTDIPRPPRKYPDPVQEGERIIAFSMSDGDNLQIMAGGFINAASYFGHPARGTFPMSWEFPPSMGRFVPRGVKNFYEEAATGDNLDCFIAGPSGAGYAFHHAMPSYDTYAMHTGQYMERCGLTVATLINENNADWSEMDAFLERPEIMGLVYKDWVPYNKRKGEIYWHNGKPCVSYKYLLWAGDVGEDNSLGDWVTTSDGIKAMPSSPATDQGSYAIINANAWSFGSVGGPMQAILNTIELLPENTRLVTVEELIILLRNNFGDPVSEEEYYNMN